MLQCASQQCGRNHRADQLLHVVPPCGGNGDKGYFLNSSSGGRSGALPYLATYIASYLAYLFGSHLKHCDLARSWISHQSPSFLAFAATVSLQRLHMLSGTPCSWHHQSPCFVSSFVISFLPSPFFSVLTSPFP